jgi:hypothetical protein
MLCAHMASWGYNYDTWDGYYWEDVLGCGLNRGYVNSSAEFVYFPADHCWALYHDDTSSDILCSLIDGCEF